MKNQRLFLFLVMAAAGLTVFLLVFIIGPIEVGNVRASVNGAPMKRSLFCMSILGRLSGYDFSRETLTLHP